MICWRCGSELDQTNENCPVCGAARPTQRRRRSIYEAEPKPASAEQSSAAEDSMAQTRRFTGKASLEAATVGVPAAKQRTGRSASQPPRASAPKAQPPRGSRSLPPQRGSARARMDDEQPDYLAPAPPVKRHQYEAILPETQSYDHVNWLRLIVIATACVVVLVASLYIFLRVSDPGQQWLASMGREASMEAYHTMGRTNMTDGAITQAVWALEIAQAKDPNNLEVLLDLGRAYLAADNEEMAEVALSRAIEHWPEYPEPYRLLINLMQEQNRDFEAVQLAEIAYEKSGDSQFDTMLGRMTPAMPAVSVRGNRFEEVFDLELSADEGATIYYTLLGDEDPMTEAGIEYTGPIFLDEGVWKLRAVAEKGGMYSKEQVQTYSINKPIPDMPKASLKSGTYDSVRTVSLSAGEGTTIYYTMDDTRPTTESSKYEGPITLRIGKMQLRAIAVDVEGKTSNEMSVEYKCEGRTKQTMSESDTIASHKLYSTTMDQFISAHGTPTEELDDGYDVSGTYTKLVYPFGHASFLNREGRDSVLVELSTTSTEFSGPRSIGIGSRLEDVIGAFRDEGGEYNAQGGRILYKLTTGKLGMLTKLGEDEYQISYYTKLDNGQHIELTYYTKAGLVTSMFWVQYDVAQQVQ